MAGTNPFSQLFGNYEALKNTRPIKSGGKPIQPMEYMDPSAIVDDMMYAVKDDVDRIAKNLSLTRQAKKIFIDDVKRALVAQTRPSGMDYNIDRALEMKGGDDAEAANQVAGVQLAFDLNPLEWIKDPKKKLSKTVESTIKAVVNMPDYRTAGESEMWEHLISPQSPNKLANMPPVQAAGLAVAEKVFSKEPDDFIQPAPTSVGTSTDVYLPFTIDGLGIKTPKANQDTTVGYGSNQTKVPVKHDEVDLYRDAAKEFLKFQRGARAAGARNMGGFANSVAKAAGAEIRALDQRDALAALTPAQRQAVEEFKHRTNIIRSANGMAGGGDYDGFHFKDAAGEIVTGAGSEAWNGNMNGVKSLSSGIETYLLSDKQDTGVMTGAYKKIFGKKGSLEKALKDVKDAEAFFATLGDKKLKEFQQETASYNKFLKKLNKAEGLRKELQEATLAGAGGLVDEIKLRAVKGKLDIAVKEFSHTSHLNLGLGKMNNDFVEKHFIHGGIREVIAQTPEIVGAQNLINVASAAVETRKHEAFMDFIDKAEKDGLTGVVADHFYNIGREALSGFAPAKAVEQTMQRNHYFGLVYNPKFSRDSGIDGIDAENEAGFAKVLMEQGPLKKLYENKHTFDAVIKNEDGTLENLGRISIMGNQNLELGTHLLGRTFMEAEDGSVLSKIDVLNLLNGKDSETAPYLKPGFDAKWNDMHQRALGFRKWLYEHNDEFDKIGLGIEFVDKVQGVTPEQLARIEEISKKIASLQKLEDKTEEIKKLTEELEGLITAFGIVDSEENREKIEKILKIISRREGEAPLYGSLFSEKIGALQKAASTLSVFQQKYFAVFAIAKPLTYIREVGNKYIKETIMPAVRNVIKPLIEKATAWLLKAIGVTVSGLTEGIGLIIWPLIEKALKYILKKATDTLGKISEAIKKGDFSIIEDFVEGGVRSIIKSCTCMMIVLGIFMMPVILMFSTLVSSIAPIDPTRMPNPGEDEASTPGSWPAGPTSLCHVSGGGGGGGTEDEEFGLMITEGAALSDKVNCLDFTGMESKPNERMVIQNAALYLQAYFPQYLNMVCQGGTIDVDWYGRGADCGWAPNANTVRFGNNACYAYNINEAGSRNIFIWLLSHELAHILDYRSSDGRLGGVGSTPEVLEDGYREARNNDCGYATPTYVGGSGAACSTSLNYSEGWAQIISNYIAINRDCNNKGDTNGEIPGCDDFWSTNWAGCEFDDQYEWVKDNIFN